jgi:hypothetical protein
MTALDNFENVHFPHIHRNKLEIHIINSVILIKGPWATVLSSQNGLHLKIFPINMLLIFFCGHNVPDFYNLDSALCKKKLSRKHEFFSGSVVLKIFKYLSFVNTS